jgi:uncharacterized membrane protein YkvA (DUF1232 family)
MFFRMLVLSLRLFVDLRVPIWSKLIPILVVLYILSPLDFIPDALPILGVTDDFGLFILGLDMFIRTARPEVVNRHMKQLGFGPVNQSDLYRDQAADDQDTRSR